MDWFPTLGAIVVVLLAGCGGPQDAPVANLILITVDTYRGDHIFAERAGTPLTPELERFAERAIWYREAGSVSDCTSPGMAGILTGLWPRRSGVISNTHKLSPRIDTIASVLRRNGLRTAAFVSNPVLRAGMGFENGFEEYVQVRAEPRNDGGKRLKPSVADVAAPALAWTDGLGADERFFLWVHCMEPHGPYRPPADLQALFPRDGFDAPSDVPLLDNNSGRKGIPRYQQKGVPEADQADARDYLARYAGEVRALDRGLAEFLDALEQRGLFENSVIIITADHGEALAGDGGYWFSHQNGTRRDQVHVPLLLYYPGCAAGSVVERLVSTADVAPTALTRLGVERPAEMDGVDLLAEERTWILSETDGEIALQESSWRLVRRKGSSGFQLVDTASGSDADLSESHPEVFQRLSRRLQNVSRRPVLAEPVERKQPESDGQRSPLEAEASGGS